MPVSAYPAYVVNEPEYETNPVRVVAVNKPNSSVDQMEELVKRLLAVLTPAAPTLAKAPETSPMDKVVQLLLLETEKRKTGPSGSGRISRIGNNASNVSRRITAATTTAPVSTGTTRLAGNEVFSCGKTGHGANRCPTLDVTFPFILPGWKAEKTQTGFLMILPRMATDRHGAENDD